MKIHAVIDIPNGYSCRDANVGYCIGCVDMASFCHIFQTHLDFVNHESYDPAKCKECLIACHLLEKKEKDIEKENNKAVKTKTKNKGTDKAKTNKIKNAKVKGKKK